MSTCQERLINRIARENIGKMSLTDIAELEEMKQKPEVKKHAPKFGDGEYCARVGRCKNPDACHDCVVYKSHSAIEEERQYIEND